ncbi:hypothetical protein EGW08_015366 [Elysia chlorotica]|uniref:Spermatogenesis-associated protein 22 n=1 Tax=Elysia chlorotica TaxID=188477 RepID=A0A433T5N4_ELYCH|nr:hypothetical protein EGW08_015366 [Elysia chlorotica]
MNRPAPVPLFNYKKRQRQALVSDPDLSNQCEEKQHVQENSYPGGNTCLNPGPANKSHKPASSHTNLPSDQSYKFNSNKPSPGLMDINGKFGSSGNFRSSNFPTGNQAKITPGGKSSSHLTNSFSGQQSSSSLRGTCRGRGLGNSNMYNNSAGRGKIPQGRGQLKLNNFSSPRIQTAAARGGFGSNQANRPGGHKQAQTNQREANTTSFAGSRQQSYNNVQPGRQSAFKPSTSSKVPNGLSTTSATSCGTSKLHGNEKATFRFDENDFDFEDDSALNNKQRKPILTPSTAKRTKDKPAKDTSMRIFTCPISSLKSWVGLKVYDGPVMFEVYGLLDSATVRDSTGTGKEFILRDDTDSIKCVFYEIDRELPRLTRGQVHRVVGFADRKRGILQAVSVRPALKEERKVCQAASAASQAEMERLAAATSEQ